MHAGDANAVSCLPRKRTLQRGVTRHGQRVPPATHRRQREYIETMHGARTKRMLNIVKVTRYEESKHRKARTGGGAKSRTFFCWMSCCFTTGTTCCTGVKTGAARQKNRRCQLCAKKCRFESLARNARCVLRVRSRTSVPWWLPGLLQARRLRVTQSRLLLGRGGAWGSQKAAASHMRRKRRRLLRRRLQRHCWPRRRLQQHCWPQRCLTMRLQVRTETSSQQSVPKAGEYDEQCYRGFGRHGSCVTSAIMYVPLWAAERVYRAAAQVRRQKTNQRTQLPAAASGIRCCSAWPPLRCPRRDSENEPSTMNKLLPFSRMPCRPFKCRGIKESGLKLSAGQLAERGLVKNRSR